MTPIQRFMTVPLEYESAQPHRKRPGYRRARVLAICAVLLFHIVVIARGHGAGPIGWLLWSAILKGGGGWFVPLLVGWISLAFMLSAFMPNSAARVSRTAAMVMLAVLWAIFLALSEYKLGTLISSAPFIA